MAFVCFSVCACVNSCDQGPSHALVVHSAENEARCEISGYPVWPVRHTCNLQLTPKLIHIFQVDLVSLTKSRLYRVANDRSSVGGSRQCVTNV